MTSMNLSGERSTTLIAGIFDNADRANQTAERLLEDANLEPWQIDVVRPHDAELSRKLEPERRGIWRTLKRTHVTLGITGTVAGVLLGIGLYASGLAIFTSTPRIAIFACGLLGLFGGLLFAGLLSLRPDHDLVIAGVKDAADTEHWTVIAHPTSAQQAKTIENALNQVGADVRSSI